MKRDFRHLLHRQFKFRLAHRLAAGFGLVLGLLLVVTLLSLQRTSALEATMREMVEVHQARIAKAQAMMNAVNEVSVATLGFALTTESSDVQAQLADLLAAQHAYSIARASMFNAAGAVAPETGFLDAENNALTVTASLVGMARGNGNVASGLVSLDPRTPQSQWLKAISLILQRETEASAQAFAKSQRAAELGRLILEAISGTALAIGLAAAWLISHSVTQPLAEAIEHARRVAQGDLATSFDTSRNDEMGDLLRVLSQMRESLQHMVIQVRDSISGVASASRQIAAGNIDLSERTERAASNLQQAASSLTSLTQAAIESGVSAAHANNLAQKAAGAAERGGSLVTDVVKNMSDIDASAREIVEIVGVIEGIAFQTNILALNAAVEAAGAGDHGRGFAVVASEVRNLAQRTGQSATQIKTLIGASVSRVDSGLRLVRRTGEVMNELVDAVKRVSTAIAEVTANAAEQSAGLGEVSSAIAGLDMVTQQNAALVEQAAAAAQSLQGQAFRLAQAMSMFELNVPDGTQFLSSITE